MKLDQLILQATEHFAEKHAQAHTLQEKQRIDQFVGYMLHQIQDGTKYAQYYHQRKIIEHQRKEHYRGGF